MSKTRMTMMLAMATIRQALSGMARVVRVVVLPSRIGMIRVIVAVFRAVARARRTIRTSEIPAMVTVLLGVRMERRMIMSMTRTELRLHSE